MLVDKVVLSKEDQYALQILEDLNKPRGDGLKVNLKTRLHPDQIKQLRDFYSGKINDVFLSCGRKWGKSELIGYVLWRHALLNPGSACYYVCPENSHAREIMWNNNRMQRFLGEDSSKYIKSITNQDMVIRFKNGSYIRCIGSENYMVANGLTPHIAVYDEFKGFNPRWHTEFAPNRAAKAAPLIIIGTKPRAGNKNMDQYNEILDYMRKNSNSCYVADRTTFDNPINHLPDQKRQIEHDIAILRARGEEDVVQLEYYSKVIPGGKRAIFPMFDEKVHIQSHNDLMNEIKKDIKRLEWVWVADPGSTTVFGMLFAAFNPYTGKLYILDEIYAKDQKDTSVGIIVPRGETKAISLYPNSNLHDDWIKVADEAAAWFITECLNRYNIYFSPAEKWRGTKEDGLSLIKDQLLHNAVAISDRCENLATEMRKYAKDDSGKIPKRDDHLIDCFRYLNLAIRYDFTTLTEYVRVKDPMHENRFKSMNYDEELNQLDDLGSDFDLDFIW